MRKIKVLVLGVGGNVSQGIIKALKHSKLDLYIVGACVTTDNVGYLWCDKHDISPYASDEKFIPWVIETCQKEEIDIILTGVEENILALAKNIERIKEKTNAIFISADYEHLCIGQDKYETCQWLKENGCNYPEYALLTDTDGVKQLIEKHGFPLLVKPRAGKSAQGVQKIKTQEELDALKPDTDMVLEEYLGSADEEYTAGCYDGHFIIMHRELKNGTTYKAEVVDDAVIQQEVEKIYKKFGQAGPLNVQLRKTEDGRAVCFELNVRFSGTTAMRANFGFEDVKAMLMEYVLKEDSASCFQIRHGKAWRYDEEVYRFE